MYTYPAKLEGWGYCILKIALFFEILAT